MKPSFFNFIIRQLNKSHMNRMSLQSLTKAIRKQCDEISTHQLLNIYGELHKIKQNQFQFHYNKTNQFYTKSFYLNPNFPKPKQPHPLQSQSFQKHTIICLQQIIIKKKQQYGYQRYANLLKLHYLRLLTAIQYNLPYLNILEQFRQEILFIDVGTDIIDYVDIIAKNPTHKVQKLVETGNFIVQILNQELENLELLDLPKIKTILVKGLKNGVYTNIDQKILHKVDNIIEKNKFKFNFKEIEHVISYQEKNINLHYYYSFMINDPLQKRLNYMFLQAQNNQNNKLTNKQFVKLPGKQITNQNYERLIDKIQELQLYKPYINIFASSISALQNYSSSKSQQINTFHYNFSNFLKCYIKYHFNYLKVRGFANLQQKVSQICNNFEKLINYSIYKKVDLIRSSSVENIKLLIVLICLALKIPKLTVQHLNNQLQTQSFNKYLNSIIVTQLQMKQNQGNKNIKQQKIQTFNQIFKKSLSLVQLNENILNSVSFYFEYFYNRFSQAKQKSKFIDTLTNEINSLSSNQKKFITNHILLFILVLLNNKNKFNKQALTVTRILLDILSKNQYKKFSNQFLTIQKILNLIQRTIQIK